MKFKLFRIENDSNVFLVIKEDSKEPPFVVHGILKIVGNSYEKSTHLMKAISDELSASGELGKLGEQAMCQYFNKD